MENDLLKKLEAISKDLRLYEKRGLDTSSLKIFIKNFRNFLNFNTKLDLFSGNLNFEEKLILIKSFLSDKKAFPTVNDVIQFVNTRLNLEFNDPKQSREVTINKLINRIRATPELKDQLKQAVLSLRNEIVHSSDTKKTRKEIINVETFSRWAEIIKNI